MTPNRRDGTALPSPVEPSAPILAIDWTENDEDRSARWRSESRTPPRRVRIADDTLSADQAFRLASEGTALLWRGDFNNARQLLQAIGRRIDRKPRRKIPDGADPAADFHAHRLAQSQRARTLGMLLVPLAADYTVLLRRAPDVHAACLEALGPASEPMVIPLRELLGIVGAHEWRRKGVLIAALGATIHPHYGVFSPVRGEYVDLVATTPLPSPTPMLAFDIGTGSGVLAAVLAQRGIPRVVATDLSDRALNCAADNLDRLGLLARVELVRTDLFPAGRAQLIVCNPPWIPAKPTSLLEQAVYDHEGAMLRRFLADVSMHLAPGGEAWLILSDLAEHLGLRSRDTLLHMFAAAGLGVVDRHDTRPTHARAQAADDPLHAARRRETTSLWRLAPR